MAEERIFVNVFRLQPCVGCGCEGDECNGCSKRFEYDESYTRQEAIERIGWALMEAGLKEGCNYYAEAALNALLEGK